MKRHHIVGILVGICAIGLAIHSALSENIFETLLYIALFAIAVSTFFEDRLSPGGSHRILPFMKRHHIVGIFAGICGIGFTVRSAFSGNITDALIHFTLFSVVAVSTFFKDKLPPRWSQPILPSWIRVALVCIALFAFLFFNYLR